MRGRLITISGPDGVGKSTQAQLLVERLRREGYQARTFWFRPGYSRELDGARALVRRFSKRPLPTAEQSEARERAFARPGVSGTWLTMAVVDMALQLGVKLRLWMARGEIVVCDRYLLDARLDLELRFPAMKKQIGRAWGVIARLCPRPDGSFVLKAPPELIEQRLAGKVEPFPEALEARQVRREAYLQLEQSGQAHVIRAEAATEVVQKELWDALRGVLAA